MFLVFHKSSSHWPSTLWQCGLLAALMVGTSLFSALAAPDPDGAFFGDRTLTFVHTHREDSITVTFRRNGVYDRAALDQLNWFLRDWRSNETTTMDPRLFDILWEMQQELGSVAPIHVISAYRSPTTNGALRRKSQGVAESSLHMAGKAIDVRIPGIDTARVRATAMHVQYGGVGYYSGSDFVHVDTGQVRAWPRMSKEQLIALFPDGKTLHLPRSGSPLPGYEQARVEVRTRLAALTDTSLVPPVRGVTRTAAASMSGHEGTVKSRLAGPVQVASATASIGVTGSVTASVRDERTFLSALFVSPTEPVTSLSTPLMHKAALDQPRPLADTITGTPTVVMQFNGGARTGLDPNRFRGPAVQPLPTTVAAR